MIFRIRFRVAGGHVHCRLYVAAEARYTFAKCGDFTVGRGPEFIALCEAFAKVEFIGDDHTQTIEEASRDLVKEQNEKDRGDSDE